MRRGNVGDIAPVSTLEWKHWSAIRRDLGDVPHVCDKAINSRRAAVERAIAHLVNWKVLDTG